MTLQTALTNILAADKDVFISVYKTLYPALRAEGKEIICENEVTVRPVYFRIVREKEVPYYTNPCSLNPYKGRVLWRIFTLQDLDSLNLTKRSTINANNDNTTEN